MIERVWDRVAQTLDGDLAELARAKKALVRARQVKKITDLLRMVLVYAVCDWSLMQVCAWSVIQWVAEISDIGLLYRFRQCSPFWG